jgi:prophage regulatory protein
MNSTYSLCGRESAVAIDAHAPVAAHQYERIARPLPEIGFVRMKQLVRPLGPVPVSEATVWRWVKAKSFPSPVKLSAGTTAWPVAAVRDWIAKQEGVCHVL